MHRNSREAQGSEPYEDLFIYYLKGRLNPSDRILKSNFIGNWEEADDSILFFSSSADRQIDRLLRGQPHLKYIDRYRMPYSQWLGENFTTFVHGAFRIMPPWEFSESCLNCEADKLPIILDPGLVFGTGTHPTTRDCLEALELAAGHTSISTVLDLGTGTGLLALAAARLGGDRIVGLDLNHLAARTAKRNVRLNGLEDRMVIVQGRAEDMLVYPADLVIANIHYDVMHRLIKNREFLAQKRFILSGLMRSEAKHVLDILQRYPVKILKQWTQGGIWHTIYGEVVRK